MFSPSFIRGEKQAEQLDFLLLLLLLLLGRRRDLLLQLLLDQFERIFHEFRRLSDFVEKFDVRLAEEKNPFGRTEEGENRLEPLSIAFGLRCDLFLRAGLLLCHR